MEEDTKKLFEIGVNELPSHIPLFPLDNVLLLPFGKMPLNIFEPRYIKMILDSLKKQRLIGIVQPKDNSGEFFNVGCMGKITSFIETPDNRIVLNLDGICRFKITDSQLSQGGYYNANVKTIDFVEDIKIHDNGSGEAKFKLNLSKSKTKIGGIMLMDSIRGFPVPSKEKIHEKLSI